MENPTVSVARLSGDGKFLYKVVDTSQFQAALDNIVGGKTEECAHYRCHALLIPDPKNLYDRDAIAVSINDRLVGYISSKDNAEMLTALSAARIGAAVCEAKIVGGWLRDESDEGLFGVRLDTKLPFRFDDARHVCWPEYVDSLKSKAWLHRTIDFGPATELHRRSMPTVRTAVGANQAKHPPKDRTVMIAVIVMIVLYLVFRS